MNRRPDQQITRAHTCMHILYNFIPDTCAFPILKTVSHQCIMNIVTCKPHIAALTLHVIQVNSGEHLRLCFICGHFLINGRFHGSHAADANAFSQVVVGALGSAQPVDRFPAEPGPCGDTGQV